MKILTTLAENDYFLGVAALLNSVVKHGTYVDRVIIGYRGALPDWLPPLTRTDKGYALELPSGLPIALVEVSGDNHMVHEKPRWFRYVTDQLAPDAEEYFFFDSDIVVNNRMDFFGEWARQGIALCGDVNFIFDRRHPIRRQWVKCATDAGRDIHNQIDGYYNSGFLGWTRENKAFIQDWNDAFDLLAPHSGDMKSFRVFDRTAMVLSTNQDSLNLAAMITEQPISPIGPEAMGFTYGLRLMHHPIGPKPWRRRFTSDFFNGQPPREADLVFWRHANGSELQPYSDGYVRKMYRLCKLYRFGARYYRTVDK